MRVVVVGGGAAGLRAAGTLVAQRPDLDVLLLEQSSRIGGLIETERSDDLLIEHGPDSIATHRPGTAERLRELGLQTELVSGTDAPRRAYVVMDRDLRPLPEGFVSMAPPGVLPLLRSGLFSTAGKARMMLEPFMPRGEGVGDESVESFVQRRFGRELLERMVQPLLGGIHATPISRLSMQAALPRLLELERVHGSVALGLAAGLARGQGSPSGLPPLVSFRKGMSALTEALAARAGRIRTGTAVREIRRGPHGRFQVGVAGGDLIDADAVIVAAPAWAAATMLDALDPELAAQLAAIDHGRATCVTTAFRRADIADPLAGTGFVVPAREHRTLAACTWSSRKFPGRAPADVALLRCFVNEHDAPDAELLSAVRSNLRDLLGIEAAPTLTRVTRLARGLPRYEVGHLGRIDACEDRAAALGALALAGNAYRGLGVVDCLASGERAAGHVIAALGDALPARVA